METDSRRHFLLATVIVVTSASLLFAVSNVLKFDLGTTGWLYDSTFGSWMHRHFLVDAALNVLLPLGPLAALAFVTRPRVGASRPEVVVTATVSVFLMATLAVTTYWVMQDGPCWYDIWC